MLMICLQRAEVISVPSIIKKKNSNDSHIFNRIIYLFNWICLTSTQHRRCSNCFSMLAQFIFFYYVYALISAGKIRNMIFVYLINQWFLNRASLCVAFNSIMDERWTWCVSNKNQRQCHVLFTAIYSQSKLALKISVVFVI